MIPKIQIFGSFYYITFLGFSVRTGILQDRFSCVTYDHSKRPLLVTLEVLRVKSKKNREA